jgi:hypothetical protein
MNRTLQGRLRAPFSFAVMKRSNGTVGGATCASTSGVLRLAALLFATAAHAEDIRLALPLDCEIGQTCFIEDYVDNAPEPGKTADFTCGINSRDGHKGTDFAVLSFEDIAAGTPVLASAPGTVLRIRDDMPDDRLQRGVTEQNACGNAVLIAHQGGWQTLSCHLRQGSVSVAPGDRVDTGTPLGMVGLSGQTNHPHLHLGLYRNGELVDPFRPDATGTCGPESRTLWADPIAYTRTGLITAGFSDTVPTLDTVRSGAARRETLTPDQALVTYAHAGYAEHGDLLTLSARGPDGEVFRQEIILKSPRASVMRAFGRKAPPEGWPLGEYLGEALLTRQGKVIAHRFAHVTLSD